MTQDKPIAPYAETIGNRLLQRRLQLGLSQAEVASEVHFYNGRMQTWAKLSKSAYCLYETGGIAPDLPKIEQLAVVLKCSPVWLAFGHRATGEAALVDELDH